MRSPPDSLSCFFVLRGLSSPFRMLSWSVMEIWACSSVFVFDGTLTECKSSPQAFFLEPVAIFYISIEEATRWRRFHSEGFPPSFLLPLLSHMSHDHQRVSLDTGLLLLLLYI